MSALHARYASTFREVALRPSIQDCIQAAFLLRAGTREELAAALNRQFGPVQGALAFEHLQALFTPPAAPPEPEPPAKAAKRTTARRSRKAAAKEPEPQEAAPPQSEPPQEEEAGASQAAPAKARRSGASRRRKRAERAKEAENA